MALPLGERRRVTEAFFHRYPGGQRQHPGLGQAVLDFQAWEERSGRISEPGSRWWRAVNGLMVLDFEAALEADTGASGRWGRYMALGTQDALWDAHQRSLHDAIRRCVSLFRDELSAEQAFAKVVIDVVDRTALANQRTDSAALDALTHRYYPDVYPVLESALPALLRMRERTEAALCSANGEPFTDTGVESGRWKGAKG